MNATAEPSDPRRGFLVEGAVPEPACVLDSRTRDRLVAVLAAFSRGCTPEEIASYVAAGFPSQIDEVLEDASEAAELDALVDVLLCVQEG